MTSAILTTHEPQDLEKPGGWSPKRALFAATWQLGRVPPRSSSAKGQNTPLWPTCLDHQKTHPLCPLARRDSSSNPLTATRDITSPFTNSPDLSFLSALFLFSVFTRTPNQPTMSDQVESLIDVPKEFVKEGVQFMNKCQKRKYPTPIRCGGGLGDQLRGWI